MSARTPLLTCLAMLLLFAVPAVGQQTPGELLQSALYKQQVEGDLEGAVKILEGLIEDFGQHRELAARALIQLGRVHETLGSTRAEGAYRRILSDYPDQLAAVAEARTRLTALAVEEATASPATAESNTSADPAGMVIRRVWTYLESEFDVTGTVSADGRYLTFEDMATGDLMVRDLVTEENRRLTHNEISRAYDVGDAGISPDGRWVAYNWDNNVDRTTDLRIVGIDGSEPRVLYSHEEVVNIEVDGWSPDGADILVRLDRNDRSRQIAWVSVTDGSVRVLKSLVWPQPYDQRVRLSPDGRFVAYNVGVPDSLHSIRLLATDGSRETHLFEHPGDDHVLGWTPDGTSLLFRSERSGTEDAWVIQIDDGQPQGPPELVKKNIGRLTPRGITQDGSFYYTVSVNALNVVTATLDPVAGDMVAAPTRVSQRFFRTDAPAWSPDGNYLAYYVRTEPGPRIIVIRSLETGVEREVPHVIRNNSPNMSWSPDGGSILVNGHLHTRGDPGLYQLDAQTGHATAIVESTPGTYITGAVSSPDGKTVFYARFDLPPTRAQILARDLETGEESEIYRATEPNLPSPRLALSPDGRQLAFLDDLSGGGPGNAKVMALKLIPSAGGEPRELFRVDQSENLSPFVLAWTPDGGHVLVGKRRGGANRSQTVELWRVPVERGEPEQLGLTSEGGMSELRVHPDGRRIAFALDQRMDEIWVMENFLPKLEGGNK